MMNTENPNLLSPSVLAFVGDAVYGLYVRTALAGVNRPSGELHRLSVTMVNASAQAKAFEVIKPLLTEGETAVFKRGRNFHTTASSFRRISNPPKIRLQIESSLPRRPVKV